MNSIAEKISKDIFNAIDRDQLILPTMPEMAIKVRDIAEDKDASIIQLAKVINQDTALTARIIKVANNPLFRASRDIEDINMALSRLGMQYACNIATGLAMEQMFQATTDIVDKRMRETWQKSCEVAGICYVFCKHYTGLRPDQAALAGLIFQIGLLPILSYAEDHPSLLCDSMTLDRVIEDAHPIIGNTILTAWKFPKELRHIPINHLDYYRRDQNADYADLVTVAMLQSYAGSPTLSDVDIKNVTAFGRLGLEPDIESAEAQNLSAEMEAARNMLGS